MKTSENGCALRRSRTLRPEEEDEEEDEDGSVLCEDGCALRLVEDDTAAVRAL